MSSAKIWTGRLVIILTLALLVWWLSPLPFWACLILSAIGWAINGAIIEIEDNQPGGWSNPDGLKPPFTIQSKREVMITGARRVFIAFGVMFALVLVILVFDRLWHAS